MGHVGSKNRSLGQIFEKPFVRSRGHIYSPIIRKRGQNVCLYEISDQFENGSSQVKNWVTRSNLRITVQKAQVSKSRAIMALLFIFGDFCMLSFAWLVLTPYIVAFLASCITLVLLSLTLEISACFTLKSEFVFSNFPLEHSLWYSPDFRGI